MIKNLFITLAIFLMLGGIGEGQTRSGSPSDQQEGSAHVTGDIGSFIMGVENEDQADFSTADKAYVPLALTKEGNLLIECKVGCSGGTQFAVQDVAGATDSGTAALVIRDDSLTTLTASDGDYARLVQPKGGDISVHL